MIKAHITIVLSMFVVLALVPNYVAAYPTAVLIGLLDSNAGDKNVSAIGWASDPDYPGAISVHIYVDGTFFDAVNANQPYTGHGNHGFNYGHTSFGRGQHTVQAYAIGVAANGIPDGQNPSIGSYTWYFYTTDCPTYFQGQADSWCEASESSNYWSRRQTDTKRFRNDNIAYGIDNSYGGTLFQLYNNDRSRNLLMEHGGAGVQLSIWGTSPTPATPCNGWGDSYTLNPIQAIAAGCVWDATTNDVDYSASLPSDGWTIRDDDPYHFTRVGPPWTGMKFYQTTYMRPDYIQIDYQITNGNQIQDNTSGWRDQEMPAIFTGANINSTAYWTDISGQIVSATLGANRKVQLAGTEGWWTICDAPGTHCVTAATFSPEIVEASLERKGLGGYMTALGHYKVLFNMSKSWTVYIFPYRYDQVGCPGCPTVRQRIDYLRTPRTDRLSAKK